MDQDETTIPLSHVIRAVLALSAQPPAGYYATGRTAPGYRTLHLAAIGGEFPAEIHNNRWRVATVDLPMIAERLGLIEPMAQAATSAWLPAHRQASRPRAAWPSQQPPPRSAQKSPPAQPARRKVPA